MRRVKGRSRIVVVAAIVAALSACDHSTHDVAGTRESARPAVDTTSVLDTVAHPATYDVGDEVVLDGAFFLRNRYVSTDDAVDGEILTIPPEYVASRASLVPAVTPVAVDATETYEGPSLVVSCDAAGLVTIASTGAPDGLENGSLMVRDERNDRVTMRAAVLHGDDGAIELLSRSFGEGGPESLHIVFSHLGEKPLARRLTMRVDSPGSSIHMHVDDDEGWTFQAGRSQ